MRISTGVQTCALPISHAQGAVGADGFEHRQSRRIAVDSTLQFGAGIANVPGIDENRRDPGVDQRRFEGTHTRSEARRVGKEWGRTCRLRVSQHYYKKKVNTNRSYTSSYNLRNN